MAKKVDTEWVEDGKSLHVKHDGYTGKAEPQNDGTWMWSVHRAGKVGAGTQDPARTGHAIKVATSSSEGEAKQQMLAAFAAAVEAAGDGS
ncbi:MULTISPECIES: hypothetical protein [Nocardiaceae]|uniref:hypothetical protein n=1 Tax=Nocardiaceae TaxID=85025 RepID=UPI00119CF308|nr:hypothetical protein [Prescottella equi]